MLITPAAKFTSVEELILIVFNSLMFLTQFLYKRDALKQYAIMNTAEGIQRKKRHTKRGPRIVSPTTKWLSEYFFISKLKFKSANVPCFFLLSVQVFCLDRDLMYSRFVIKMQMKTIRPHIILKIVTFLK